ncbi:MAG: DUF1761 domain-containing protein [Terrimesophilobacter sp.]
MIPEINIWAVLVATLSTMVVGTIWYTPRVFGSWWEKAARVEAPANAVRAIVITVIVSFVSAWVLAGAAAIAQEFYGGSFLVNSLVTAIILWAGFTAARFVTHDAFENRPPALTVLNISHELVTYAVMALIIGLFGIGT